MDETWGGEARPVGDGVRRLFRDVNDRLRELGSSFKVVVGELQFVCECEDARCLRPAPATLEEYDRVRSRHDHYLVSPGHAAPGERIVARTTRHAVVASSRVGRAPAAGGHGHARHGGPAVAGPGVRVVCGVREAPARRAFAPRLRGVG